MKGLTEGRMVHFVMPNGEHRPAVIVKVWSQENGCSNLQVITDGTNDSGYTEAEKKQLENYSINPEGVAHGHVWATSKVYSDVKEPGTWHWIEQA